MLINVTTEEPFKETTNIEQDSIEDVQIPLEQESLDNLYTRYTQFKDKETLNEMVKRLEPTINYTLANLGASNDPLIRAEAKVVVANAIPKYDPSYGASIPTFITNQLQQLQRTVKKYRSPIKVPERLQLDAYRLNEAEKQFMEDHNREPDLLELSDLSGLSIKRIKKIRDQIFKSTSEGTFGDAGSTESTDYLDEAMEYVYHDLDYKDKKILEHSTGFGGSQILTPAELANKLGISQSQISRRTAKIALRIQEIAKALGT